MGVEVRYASSHNCRGFLLDLPGHGRDGFHRHGQRTQGTSVQRTLGRPAQAGQGFVEIERLKRRRGAQVCVLRRRCGLPANVRRLRTLANCGFNSQRAAISLSKAGEALQAYRRWTGELRYKMPKRDALAWIDPPLETNYGINFRRGIPATGPEPRSSRRASAPSSKRCNRARLRTEASRSTSTAS